MLKYMCNYIYSKHFLTYLKLHTNNGFFHLDVSMYPLSNIIFYSPDHYKRYIEIESQSSSTSGTKHQAMPSINIPPVIKNVKCIEA